ncbi:MAG: hypothetical protein PHR35_06295 [Kiritimatiellae bacterium]|nr:hypothetical protein [Kiritimatiellia bacterium]
MGIWRRSTEAARIGPESQRVIMGRLRRHRGWRNREVGAAPASLHPTHADAPFSGNPDPRRACPGGGTRMLRSVQEPPPGR